MPELWERDGTDQVELWRTARALELGYTLKKATWIAEHHTIDMHELADLVRQGATKTVALRILAPL